MADPRKNRTYNENKVITILGPGTLLRGNLQCMGTIRIEGTVFGDVASEDSVVLLESGRVQGSVTAGQVIVGGEVAGNVFAVDRIEITAQGRVAGDMTAPRISIHEGVLFEGRCTMKPGPDPGISLPDAPVIFAAKDGPRTVLFRELFPLAFEIPMRAEAQSYAPGVYQYKALEMSRYRVQLLPVQAPKEEKSK